jgi:adenylate cyclase class 2
MYEVEVKVRADHDAIQERLEHLGATQEATVEQVDTYYDAPHRDFAESDEALRLREIRPDGQSAAGAARTEFTYKGPLIGDGTKTREEHESRVEDGDAMDAALQGLGFNPAHAVEKHRRRYSLRGYTVTLDRVRELGEFVEVEKSVPESEIDPAREGALDLLADLGLDADDGITTSYLGLLLETAAEK